MEGLHGWLGIAGGTGWPTHCSIAQWHTEPQDSLGRFCSHSMALVGPQEIPLAFHHINCISSGVQKLTTGSLSPPPLPSPGTD